MIVNGIASAIPFAGSGIGVGGNTSGLINADIQVNGTMELLNQGIGWANGAPGDFFMDALTGTGVMVANYTAVGGQTRVRLGNNNGSGNFSGSIVDGTGNQIIPLTKNGTGTQTFSGTNTYTGNTIVERGRAPIAKRQCDCGCSRTGERCVGATLQLLSNETISSYVGAGDGVGSNDSTLALGNNVLTTTAGASIANVTTGTTGGIVAGTSIVDNDDDNNVTGTGIFLQAASGVGTFGESDRNNGQQPRSCDGDWRHVS